MPQSKIRQNLDDVLMASTSGEQRWVPTGEVELFIAEGMKKVLPDSSDPRLSPTTAEVAAAEVTAGEEEPHWSERVWDTMRDTAVGAHDIAADTATGAAKAAARSVLGAGAFLRENVPGGQAIHDAAGGDWATVDLASLEPTNRAQQAGVVGEQIGEFFIPVGGAVGGLARKVPALRTAAPAIQRIADSATDAGVTLAQGGSVPAAIASAALQGVIPSAHRGEGVVRDSAERSMAQSLGATTNEAKARAAELAPEMLERGVGGTQRGMFRRSQGEVGRLGQLIGAEVSEQAQRGATVKTARFLEDMKAARLEGTQGGEAGIGGAIYGTETILAKLEGLEAYAASLGDRIPIRHAQAIKKKWDDIVSQSGLYGRHADANPTDRAAAWVIREGANSMRKLISEKSPTLAKLNAEFSFWKGLEDVSAATALRTQAQGPSMTQTLTGGFGGAIVGASTGNVIEGFMGAAGIAALSSLLRSSYFRSRAAGPLKVRLADALSSGDQGRVLQAIARFSAAAPSLLSNTAPLAFNPNPDLTRRQ